MFVTHQSFKSYFSSPDHSRVFNAWFVTVKKFTSTNRFRNTSIPRSVPSKNPKSCIFIPLLTIKSRNYVPSSKNPQPAQIQNTVQCYGIPQQQLIQAGSQATTTIPIMTTGAQIGTPVQQTQYLQHQLMNTTIQGQSIQGVIHQPTVVSSVPQSIHLTQQPAQMQVQKISKCLVCTSHNLTWFFLQVSAFRPNQPNQSLWPHHHATIV